MRTLAFLLAVAVVVACNSATEPQPFTLGPACELSRHIEGVGMLRVRYADCTSHNTDSLRADGWAITWDTTHHR